MRRCVNAAGHADQSAAGVLRRHWRPTSERLGTDPALLGVRRARAALAGNGRPRAREAQRRPRDRDGARQHLAGVIAWPCLAGLWSLTGGGPLPAPFAARILAFLPGALSAIHRIAEYRREAISAGLCTEASRLMCRRVRAARSADSFAGTASCSTSSEWALGVVLRDWEGAPPLAAFDLLRLRRSIPK